MTVLLCALLFWSPLLSERWGEAPGQGSSLKSWMDGAVSIVLSDVEKKSFARLSTDPERQHFIDNFWASRDPDPETRANEFQEEFNKRVETADAMFGGEWGLEGWRTERGRFYVLLGPPSSRAQFKNYGQLRPIELWFYSGKKEYPQLPAFFYLMFFQRDEIGDYRRYSPFIDQPQSLVKATIRGNKDAYAILAKINTELAHASMSLLPGEPLDANGFMPSMTSDAVLAQINQIPKRDYERAALLRELVSVRLKFGGTTTMTLYPIATAADVFAVDLAIDRPDGLGRAKVEAVVSRDGIEQGRIAGLFEKDAPLVGRFILKGGDYLVEATVWDPEDKQRFAARDVLHLKPATDALAMSELLFFRSVEPVGTEKAVPFTYRGYRFLAEPRRQFHPGDKLQVLFQLAAPRSGSNPNSKLSIDYTIAGINNAAHRWTFHDDVGVDRFDADGLLLNSRTLSIRDVPPGRYFLIIMARDSNGHRASQTVSFEVTETSEVRSP